MDNWDDGMVAGFCFALAASTNLWKLFDYWVKS